MNKINYLWIVFFFLLSIFVQSCDDNDLSKIETELELIKAELANQKKILEDVKKNISISKIDYGKNQYTIHFSNGESITLSNGKTPVINIGANGNWYINGKDTGLPSRGLDDEIPEISIGSNGNWIINGEDTDIKSVAPENERLIILSIIDISDQISFILSDKSVITVKKNTGSIVPFLKNNPLPIGKGTLKVLCIGNSYTEDATDHLNMICSKSGLDLSKICVYNFISGGASLEKMYNFYKNNDKIKIYRAVGSLDMKKVEGTLKEILAQDWDIITLQQKSSLSIDYKSYHPFLRVLIKGIKLHCTNQQVTFAWQQAWAYWSGYGGEPTGLKRFEQICACSKEQEINDGINIIIPTGTAIQNARNTNLQTPHDLTRDGIHLSFGTAKYIAACTWFQAILAPVFNKNIVGNSCTYNVTDYEKKLSKYEYCDVTDTNKTICQLCASLACIDNYNVSSVE